MAWPRPGPIVPRRSGSAPGESECLARRSGSAAGESECLDQLKALSAVQEKWWAEMGRAVRPDFRSGGFCRCAAPTSLAGAGLRLRALAVAVEGGQAWGAKVPHWAPLDSLIPLILWF